MIKTKEIVRVESNWYDQLVEDIRAIEFNGVVMAKHAIGKRILEDELKFGKPAYGRKKIEGLASDLDVSSREVYRCIQYARQFPEIDTVCQYSWRKITKMLQEPREEPETPPLPKGKFNVIYADPPWQYDNSGLGGAASKHYVTMPIEEVIELKDKNGKTIQSCCAGDCVLFMWATNPFLKDAFDVIQAWGFSYKTNICWTKEGRATYGRLGFYVYGNHELLLIATKGSILPDGEKPTSLLSAKKGKHSRKPDEFYGLIQGMYPQGKYLELFARSKYNDRWKTWGLEA